MNVAARVLLLAVGLASCRGGPPHQIPPLKPDHKPPPNAAKEPATTQSPATETIDAALPLPAQPRPDEAVTRHANSAVSVAFASPAAATATLQVQLAAGADAARPGVAELAAEVLVAGSDATTGRRSLRQIALELGGVLTVDVGARGIWITLQLPTELWPQGAQAMLAALRDPAESRSQLESIRDEYLNKISRDIWERPEPAGARALLAKDPGTGTHVANLLERDASEVRQFISAYCVPDQTVVAVEAAGEAAVLQQQLDSLITAAKWRRTPPHTTLPTPAASSAQRGIFWATSAAVGPGSTSLVLSVPDADDPNSADAMVLLACVTLDGVGGRLEKLLSERGLGHLQFRSSWEHCGQASALVLSTRCSPVEASLLWRAFDEVRQSLLTSPPNASELELAMRRARLTARLRTASTTARLRERVDAVLRTQRDTNEPTANQRLAQLARSGGAEASDTIGAFVNLPAAMLVIGGQPPAALLDVATFELLPAGAIAKLAGAPPAAQAAAGKPWLAPSLEAIGGEALLRRTIGHRVAREIRVADAAAWRESLQWRRPAELTRTRELLGQTIQTEIKDKTATESVGELRTSLDSVQTRQLLRAEARHPLALLAAHARGELAFRPVAQRVVDGREVLVLEAASADFERLRIHVDATSRLVRVVESWETMETGLRVQVQESWSDYRSSNGLRAPFRCITEIDDGSSRVETIYSSWEPLFAGP